MTYINFDFDGEKFYIELDGEQYAVRQIIIQPTGRALVSCRDDCLAEGKVDLEGIEGEISYIEKAAFEKAWSQYTSPYRKIWSKAKSKYPIGSHIKGTIRYFYPQGVIIDIGDIQGCAGYHSARENSTPNALNVKCIVSGTVRGYDEDNMWLLIDECMAK